MGMYDRRNGTGIMTMTSKSRESPRWRMRKWRTQPQWTEENEVMEQFMDSPGRPASDHGMRKEQDIFASKYKLSFTRLMDVNYETKKRPGSHKGM